MSSSPNQQQVRAWLLTGPPGIGKSTVVSRVVYLLRMQGVGVGGCITRERREARERVGFTISDLMTGKEGELATSRGALGPRVGRYRVNIEGLARVGAKSLQNASAGADVIVIDEVGPMELTSADFRRAAGECIKSGKPMLAVIHEQMKDPLIEQFRELQGGSFIEVTLHNREGLAKVIASQLLETLSSERKGENERKERSTA